MYNARIQTDQVPDRLGKNRFLCFMDDKLGICIEILTRMLPYESAVIAFVLDYFRDASHLISSLMKTLLGYACFTVNSSHFDIIYGLSEKVRFSMPYENFHIAAELNQPARVAAASRTVVHRYGYTPLIRTSGTYPCGLFSGAVVAVLPGSLSLPWKS